MLSLFKKDLNKSCGSSRGVVKSIRPSKPILKKKEYDISAGEARELADKYTEEEKKKELDDILQYIRSAAEVMGWYNINYHKLNDKTINALKERGFKIHIFDRTMRISWEQEQLDL